MCSTAPEALDRPSYQQDTTQAEAVCVSSAQGSRCADKSSHDANAAGVIVAARLHNWNGKLDRTSSNGWGRTLSGVLVSHVCAATALVIDSALSVRTRDQ